MHVRKHSDRAWTRNILAVLSARHTPPFLEVSTAEHQNEVKFLLCKSRILDTFAVKAHTIDLVEGPAIEMTSTRRSLSSIRYSNNSERHRYQRNECKRATGLMSSFFYGIRTWRFQEVGFDNEL